MAEGVIKLKANRLDSLAFYLAAPLVSDSTVAVIQLEVSRCISPMGEVCRV
ncbi:MAG: hypothetical protein JWM16_3245 [Verrucomicrobiales bacterium]|nr:hypothetical protein [Verrucomicrobiales bacterium]